MVRYVQGFEGARAGYTFGTGAFGLGYYTDAAERATEAFRDMPVEATSAQPRHAADEEGAQPADSLGGPSTSAPSLVDTPPEACDRPFESKIDPAGQAADAQQRKSAGSALSSEALGKAPVLHDVAADNRGISRAELQSALGPDFGASSSESLPVSSAASAAVRQGEGTAPLPEAENTERKPRHYWGQALQYLEKSAEVVKGEPSPCQMHSGANGLSLPVRAAPNQDISSVPCWRQSYGLMTDAELCAWYQSCRRSRSRLPL